MTSRSDCEPLPKPTLSPSTRGYLLSVSVFHCRRVVCACSAGAVGSLSNKPLSPKLKADAHPNDKLPWLRLRAASRTASDSWSGRSGDEPMGEGPPPPDDGPPR